MREIVGAKINGSTITNSLFEIIEAAKAGGLIEVYDRKQMQFMSSCDLGRNWDLMASGPTLFLIEDDGKMQWPNDPAQPPIGYALYNPGTTRLFDYAFEFPESAEELRQEKWDKDKWQVVAIVPLGGLQP